MSQSFDPEKIHQKFVSYAYSPNWIKNFTRYSSLTLSSLGFLLFALLSFFTVSEYGRSSDSISELSIALSSVSLGESALRPEQPVPDKLVSAVVERNMFGLKEKAKPTARPGASPTPKPKKSNTQLELIGTFVSPELSEAIIENKKTKTQEGFRVGEEIFEEAVLKRVLPHQVEIERDGKIELLILEEGGGSDPVAEEGDFDERIEMDEGLLEESLENLPLLLTQARAVPYFKDGKPVGLRLFAIRNGSLYEKAGLKNGDILKDVNGNSLADISKAAKLFEMLRDEKKISLSLERNREAKKFQYTIK